MTQFELATEPMPIPLSCAMQEGEPVIIFAQGAIVNEALIRVLNDLLPPPNDDEPGALPAALPPLA